MDDFIRNLLICSVCILLATMGITLFFWGLENGNYPVAGLGMVIEVLLLAILAPDDIDFSKKRGE